METDHKKTHRPAMQRGGAAVKECIRIFSTTVLSLLPPLWLLLFARIAAARRQTLAPIYDENSYVISIFLLHSVTTVVLISLIFAAAVAALAQGFAGDERAWLIGERRRLHGAVIWLSLVQVCLSLWVHGVADGSDRAAAAAAGGIWGPVSVIRSVVLALGLHEMVVYWRRNVVKPVVDEAVFATFSDDHRVVERVVLAAAFGCLWWRRLRGEVEEMMVVVRKDMEVVDVLGWLLCGLMAAAGGARVVNSLLWLMTRIFRQHAAVNEKIGAAVDQSFGSKFDIETAV